MKLQEVTAYNLKSEAGEQGELPLDNPNTMGAKAKRSLGKLAKGALGAVKGAVSKVKSGAVVPTKKGDVRKAQDGKEYKWAGALWVDTATNKPIGVQASLQNGLGHPNLDPIIAAAKTDPAVAKAIKALLT